MGAGCSPPAAPAGRAARASADPLVGLLGGRGRLPAGRCRLPSKLKQAPSVPCPLARWCCREFYADVLVKYGLAPRRMPWNNLYDEEDMLRALRNGTIE